jgi:hypothetical protein
MMTDSDISQLATGISKYQQKNFLNPSFTSVNKSSHIGEMSKEYPNMKLERLLGCNTAHLATLLLNSLS